MKWVFLPGLDGAGIFFEPFLKVLPKEIEPVVFAYPGEEKLDYDQLFEWLLPQLPKGEPFLVIAESFGGPLAVRLAAAGPAGMVGAVVSASFVKNPLPRIFCFGPVKTVFRFSFPEWLVNWLLADRQAGEEMQILFRRAMKHSKTEVLAHRARAALAVDVEEELRKCRLPVLFLEGLRDRLIPRSAMRRVRRIRPDLPVVSLEGAHFLLQQRAEECLKEILAFAKKLEF